MDELHPLLDDHAVARLLGYHDTVTFRRNRKRLEAAGFPMRRPIVKRYSPTEIRAWIDGQPDDSQQSETDPLLRRLAGQWGDSPSVEQRRRRERRRQIISEPGCYPEDVSQPISDEPGSFVYFIAAKEAIKIGRSKNPESRLLELQMGASETLELLGVIMGGKKV